MHTDYLSLHVPECKLKNAGKMLELGDELKVNGESLAEVIQENFVGKGIRFTLTVEEDGKPREVSPYRSFNTIGDFTFVMRNACKQYDDNLAEMSKKEAEIRDIEHFVELNDFDRNTGYKLAKLLKQKRQERRKIKDANELLKLIKNFVVGHPGLEGALSEASKYYYKILEIQKNRQYSERELDVAKAVGLAEEENEVKLELVKQIS